MMRTRILRLGAAVLLGAAMFSVVPGRAVAATSTQIIVPARTEVVAGEYGEVLATLQTASGASIPDERLLMTLLDNVLQRRTNTTGSTSFRIRNDLAPGTYPMSFRFPGTSVYTASQAEATLVVTQPTVDVQTMPPLEGVLFVLGDERAESDVGGLARIPYTPPRPLELPTPGDLELSDRVVARFDRWFGSPASDQTATYSLFYRIQLSFTDLAGSPVDRSLVTGITIKNSVGERFELTNEREMWVQGSRVVPLSGGFESKDIYYTVESVTVNGANVVNRSQQKFIPREVVDWSIHLLFYSAEVKVHDALLRFSTGSAIRLEYPDGHVVELPLVDGQLSLPSLPRGNYTISVVGPGLTIPRPLAVTRDQEVVLELISWLDISLVAIGVLVGMAALLLLGRPILRRHLGRWREPGFALKRIRQGVLIGLLIGIVLVLGPPMVQSYLSIFAARPGTEAQASGPAATVAAPSTPTSSASVPQARAVRPTSYEVQPGDTLRAIAARFYDDETAWSRIYAANRSAIQDPDALEVGTRLTLP
ncbi:MAG TPA: LysM peptidoglycan-binding domain-containing protein [Candidatus Dormibacteraeota bacterium]|nr:LysM peptidoglycan-binding domain-containing protein [Candidatus Dormibacteraeota bacterium]